MSDLVRRVLVLVTVISLLFPVAAVRAADPKSQDPSFQLLQVAATTTIRSTFGPLTSMLSPMI